MSLYNLTYHLPLFFVMKHILLFFSQAIVTEADVPNPKSASVDIQVNVMDRNDNAPQFPPAGYQQTIPEGNGRRPVILVNNELFYYSKRHLDVAH